MGQTDCVRKLNNYKRGQSYHGQHTPGQVDRWGRPSLLRSLATMKGASLTMYSTLLVGWTGGADSRVGAVRIVGLPILAHAGRQAALQHQAVAS